jgi:hypothetical protein
MAKAYSADMRQQRLIGRVESGASGREAESTSWCQPEDLVTLCQTAAAELPSLFAAGRGRGRWSDHAALAHLLLTPSTGCSSGLMGPTGMVTSRRCAASCTARWRCTSRVISTCRRPEFLAMLATTGQTICPPVPRHSATLRSMLSTGSGRSTSRHVSQLFKEQLLPLSPVLTWTQRPPRRLRRSRHARRRHLSGAPAVRSLR